MKYFGVFLMVFGLYAYADINLTANRAEEWVREQCARETTSSLRGIKLNKEEDLMAGFAVHIALCDEYYEECGFSESTDISEYKAGSEIKTVLAACVDLPHGSEAKKYLRDYFLHLVHNK